MPGTKKSKERQLNDAETTKVADLSIMTLKQMDWSVIPAGFCQFKRQYLVC